MLIRFVGPGHHVRVVGEFEWGRKAGWVQDVPAELAANLLTTPGEQFEVADEEPMLEYMSKDDAGLLAINGIGSLEEYRAVVAGRHGGLPVQEEGSHGGLPLRAETEDQFVRRV